MEKAKLKYIEEQCNRIANGMERISGFTGKGQLYIYEHVDISKGIEVIAAALAKVLAKQTEIWMCICSSIRKGEKCKGSILFTTLRSGFLGCSGRQN